MANPATGAQATPPAIDIILFLYSLCVGGHWFCLDVDCFVQIQFGGPATSENKDWGPNTPRSSALTASQMRQRPYHKSSPTPTSYAAMLVTHRHIGGVEARDVWGRLAERWRFARRHGASGGAEAARRSGGYAEQDVSPSTTRRGRESLMSYKQFIQELEDDVSPVEAQSRDV